MTRHPTETMSNPICPVHSLIWLLQEMADEGRFKESGGPFPSSQFVPTTRSAQVMAAVPVLSIACKLYRRAQANGYKYVAHSNELLRFSSPTALSGCLIGC